MWRYRLLTIIALYKTFQFLFGLMLLQIRENHLHVFPPLCLALICEWRITVTLTINVIDYHRLCPNFDILVSRIVNLYVKIIRPTAHRAFFIKCGQFFQQETTKGRILLGIKHLMLILDIITYLCEIRPFIFETSSPPFGVLLETSFTNLWIICEITLNKGYLLITDIFLFDIAQNIVMELSIKTEKHLGIIEITTFSHLLSHRFKQTLIHTHFVHFQLEMSQDL